MAATSAAGARENSLRTLARIPVVRRMWAAITFSSFGDWLGLLATTALAQQLTNHQSVSAQGAAISGVLVVRLSPDLLFGPFAAALADKVDRRKLVIGGDLAAGLLYASIAIGYNLVWLYVAQFLVEAVGLFTQPAKQVIQTTIVPKRLLATANQISLFSVYGTVPLAAGVFALLSAVNRLTGGRGAVDVAIVAALLLDAVSFLVSVTTVFLSRHLIPVRPADQERGQSIVTLLREGIGFVRGASLIKALYVGIIGAFAAGGLTVGVAQLWVRTLDAGAAGYSVMFGTVFTGLALGMLLGPKLLPGYTRSRVFALAISSAGVSLLVMSLLRDFTLAVLFAALVGLFAGVAWIIGYTLIGQEVEDRLRGRVFAFVLSSVRLTLLATIAVGPIMAGALGDHSIAVGDEARLSFSGPGLTLLIGGVLALLVGVYALRRATPSRTRVRDLLSRRILGSSTLRRAEYPGLLLTIDGADAAATARWVDRVVADLDGRGLVVVQTSEASSGSPATLQGESPADRTPDAAAGAVGAQVRRLLAAEAQAMQPETAALLSSAERAEHVATVIRPALDSGAVVVCDRFVLTSMALYGGGRGADLDHIRLADDWATGGLQPDLTLVVADTPEQNDLDAAAVDAVLHQAVDADRDRHLLVPPSGAEAEVQAQLAERLDRLVRARGARLSRAASDPARGEAAGTEMSDGEVGAASPATPEEQVSPEAAR